MKFVQLYAQTFDLLRTRQRLRGLSESRIRPLEASDRPVSANMSTENFVLFVLIRFELVELTENESPFFTCRKEGREKTCILPVARGVRISEECIALFVITLQGKSKLKISQQLNHQDQETLGIVHDSSTTFTFNLKFATSRLNGETEEKISK
ncbi:unnamed protein product [Nesidiocoris tenuis]|uniref:Uncharacterized protein n=1 Tax=Nesidiocoris tenuis TaxID=355587 RepID=A0A6H5GUZ1_9HEMI|nr:unnamed protein product [Nesidiocoris tenuis]